VDAAIVPNGFGLSFGRMAVQDKTALIVAIIAEARERQGLLRMSPSLDPENTKN
jgi:hypothetical protein